MASYTPPLKDILFTLRQLSGLDRVLELDAFDSIDPDVVDQVIGEAGKFASEVLAPLNVDGDQQGCRVENRSVVIPEGFSDLYRQFVDNGWQTLPLSADLGGMGLPETVGTAAAETWLAANLAFSLCPLLTNSAIVAIETHASNLLRDTYLPRMVSGEWTGTMNLTEPQAGSDLAAIRTLATPENDHYRISGTKIFITWGDNPFSENVIHLVLARLPDAPEGVRGISLFLVPKLLLAEDGTIGEPNDLYPASVEKKLGIHASPTCVMNYGETTGAIGYLIGEPNNGLACMFTMMNRARLEVGTQGLAMSERAYQLARAWAFDRVQGRGPGSREAVAIVHHPDVKRMLMIMKSQIEAMRPAAYVTAGLIDLSHHLEAGGDREVAERRTELLTPIVKAWMTEVAQEITSLGVQIHGGMGFIEETGAAQYMRDARILPIYEGTSGIQANDLVGRKILADEGTEIRTLLEEIGTLASALAEDERTTAIASALTVGVGQLDAAVTWLVENAKRDPALPGSAAFNLLMLAGTVIGGWQLARAAEAIINDSVLLSDDCAFCDAKFATAAFYAEHIMPRAAAYAKAATAGPEVLQSLAIDSL